MKLIKPISLRLWFKNSRLVNNRWLLLVYLTLMGFSRSNGPNMAAGVAYFALFSLFPLSLASIAIAGFFFADKGAQLEAVYAIQKLIPVSTDYLSDTIEGVVDNRGPISLIGLLGLIWSGLAVFSAVRKGINHAWGIGKPPNLLQERLIDLSMLTGIGLAGCVVLVLSAKVFEMPGLGGWLSIVGGDVLAKVLVSLLSLLVSFLVLLLMYKHVPHRKVAWGDVWLSALLGATFLEGGKNLFAWYVSNFSSFNVVYGSLGTIMAILVWVYISAIILLLSAHLSAVYCRIIGSESRHVS